MDPFTLSAGFGFGALLVGIIFSVLCQSIAAEKRRSTGWWGLWGFLTTFIALFILVVLPAAVSVAAPPPSRGAKSAERGRSQ